MRLLRNNQKEGISDDTLLTMYRTNSDMEALGQLFNRYMDLVFGLSMKYLKDPMKAEDATMGIFEELTIKVNRHDIRNFKSWLYILSKNYCLQLLRKEKREQSKNKEILVQSEAFMHPVIEDDKEILENGLTDCMEKLDLKQRKCIELFYYESKSYKEIAGILDVNSASVRSRLQNGRRNLKICMEKKNAGKEFK